MAANPPGMTLADVLERYGEQWHIEVAEFCYCTWPYAAPRRRGKRS
ncbi:MAG: hypothetical protein ACRDND_09975 [Streptosporangiaceae bacterium]